MPIHLRPFSRRNFLRSTLLATGAFAVAPELFAASRRTDSDSWAFFSDTHISADPAKIARNINMTEHLKTVSAEVLALPRRPAGLFVVGDCAYNQGEPEDYTQFTKLIEPLRKGGLPLHLTLGNHDQREHFWTALSLKKNKRPVADKQASLVKGSNVNWFILDSLETTRQTPGLLGTAQLDWLAKSLDANKRTPAVIIVHHNPSSKDTNVGGLKDSEALFDIIRPRTQVKAWVYGHTHTWRIKEDTSGIHFVNLPPVAWLFHPTDPAGWVHATARKDGMKFELRCLDAAHKDHGQIVDLKWRA